METIDNITFSTHSTLSLNYLHLLLLMRRIKDGEHVPASAELKRGNPQTTAFPLVGERKEKAGQLF